MSKKDKNPIIVDSKIYELMKKAGVSLLNVNIKIKDKKEKKEDERKKV